MTTAPGVTLTGECRCCGAPARTVIPHAAIDRDAWGCVVALQSLGALAHERRRSVFHVHVDIEAGGDGLDDIREGLG